MKRIVKVFLVLVAAVYSVHAQSWVSPADGSWGSGVNWVGGVVPLGSAPLWFTNEHSGTLTITLDGLRTNAADVAFNKGAWSLTPGIPANSSLFLNGARIITVDEGSVAFQAPVVSMGTSKIIKRGQGSATIDAPWDFLSGSTPAFEAGVTRVTADGAIYTAANKDIYVDGSASLILDGGEIGTKIIRLGQDVMPDGALFRMNSGIVNCIGSGGVVLLVGYNAEGPVNAGSARAEILGGSFSATGLVANAAICVGIRQPGTLVVNGTNGTPTLVNVGSLLFGWYNTDINNATTNLVQIGSNAMVTASGSVACIPSKYAGTLELLRGGVLRTPDVYASAGALHFDFAGGTLEILAPNSAGLLRGALCSVNVLEESTLNIDTNDVLLAQRLSGSEKLNIVGDGTLTFGGDQGGFSGTLSRDTGMVLVTNILNEGGMSLTLGGDAVLNAGANPVLAMNLVVAGDISLTSLVTAVVLKTVDLQGGTLTLGTGLDVVVETMHIDAGTNVTVFSSGHVVLYALSGGGTLTVAGGGTFDIIDQSALVADGGSVVAADGTTFNTAVSVLSELDVWSDMTLTSAAKLTVSNLNFHGGTLTWTGGAELEAVHVAVAANATAGMLLQGAGSVVTNVGSCVVAAGSVFAINPGAGVTLAVGTLSGSGTFRLNGGLLSVATIASGLNVDINAGVVAVTAPAAPATPVWTSGEPAFWVDASESGSLVAGSNLEWRDKRYAFGVYTNSAIAVGQQPAVLANELNGKSVLRFTSPASSTSYKGMVWNQRLANIRTVFWVIGAQEGGGMLLGDESLIDFFRGELMPYRTQDFPSDTPYAALFSKRYADGNRDNLPDVRNGITRMNGTAYDSFQKGFPSPGYHVISLRTADDTVAKAFASERLSGYNQRSGCQRLAEVLVFTNALTDAEILETENYLQKKWFGGDVTLASVRLGDADASFHVTGGSARINTLKLDAADLDPLSALSGIAKIEQIVVGVNGHTLSNVTQTALPFNAQDLQVKNGCVVTADLSMASSPYLWHLSGAGRIVLETTSDLHVAGIAVASNEVLSVEGTSVTLQADYLYALGAVGFTGFSDTLIDRASAYIVADISAAAASALSINWLTAAGQLSYSGATDAYIGYLDMENRALQLNVAETAQVEIHDLYGRNTLTKTGNGQTTCSGAISVNDADFTMADVFESIAEVQQNNRTFTLSGVGPYLIGTYYANSDTTKNLVFSQVASATIDTLNNNTGGAGRFYLKAVDATGLHIENINFGANKNMAFPVGQTTTIANLSAVLGSATYLYGGMLNVTGRVVNVDKLVLFNQANYLSEGVSLPDNTQLTLNLFEARANINAVVDLGENSVLTLNSGVTIETGAKLTFINGTLRLKTPLTSGTELRLIDTAVEVASGGSLTPISLVGTGSVAVASGGAVNVAETYGFTGTVDNQGGSVTLGTSRTNIVPLGPVGSPAFWVDASQAGSLLTNGANKLEWLDKRTVRDGTPGLNKATSLVRMPVIMTNELNGLPVVDFGTLGANATDERGMLWTTRLTNVRAVHWVIGTQNGGGQLLGDIRGTVGDIDYFRYHDTVTPPAGSVYTSPLWAEKFRTRTGGYVANVLNGDTRINTIPGWTNGFPSAGYHLVSIRTAGTTRGGAFASERVNYNFGTRSGAQRLGEVLVYNGVILTSAEQEANDAYLSSKWFQRLVLGYRLREDGLLALNGSGSITGALVYASSITLGQGGGMTISGDLLLGYAASQSEGTRLIVEKLPAIGEASIAVSGALVLSDKGRVTLLERKAGVYTLLESSGLLTGAENLVNWVVDALPGFTTKLVVEGNALQIHIMPKGTMVQFM
jgi:hypothetical protein